MRNKRMQQLVFMFSDVTGISKDNAEKIIMQTDTGQAVKANNQSVMYEQQTENLCSIAMELGRSEQYKEMENLFSNANITKAMKQLRIKEKQSKAMETKVISPIAKEPTVKIQNKKILLQKRKNILQKKKQNQINVRRIENANQIKE